MQELKEVYTLDEALTLCDILAMRKDVERMTLKKQQEERRGRNG